MSRAELTGCTGRCAMLPGSVLVGVMPTHQANDLKVVIDRLRFAASLATQGIHGWLLLRKRGDKERFPLERGELVYLVNRIGWVAGLLEFAEQPDGPHHHTREDILVRPAFVLSDWQTVKSVRSRFSGAVDVLLDVATSDDAMRQLTAARGADADEASEVLLSIWESWERVPKK